MTVKELQEQLSKFEAGTDVTIVHEDNADSELFHITDISLSRGTLKLVKGKPKFVHDLNGPLAQGFISVTSDF